MIYSPTLSWLKILAQGPIRHSRRGLSMVSYKYYKLFFFLATLPQDADGWVLVEPGELLWRLKTKDNRLIRSSLQQCQDEGMLANWDWKRGQIRAQLRYKPLEIRA